MATKLTSNQNTPKQGASKSSTSGSGASFRIKEFLFVCLSHWPWFVASVAIIMGATWYHLKTTTPLYQRSAVISVKSDGRGNTSAGTFGMFEDLGMYAGNNSIHDEIALITSPDIMREVVRRLNLNTRYSVDGKFRKIDIYGAELPVTVDFPDLPSDAYCSFKLTLDRDGEYEITNMVLNGRELNRGALRGRIGSPLASPLGTLNVNPAKSYNGNELFAMNVSHSPIKSAAAGFSGPLKVSIDDKAWNIMTISTTDSSPERAGDIVREIIAAYNERWMQDKRDLADNSSKFIDERIELLQRELGSVENDISSFKSANMMPDVSAVASLYMSQASQTSMSLKELRTQEYMAKYIRNYLRNSENHNKLLPSNSGIGNASLNGQIGQYNAKVLERNSLLAQSSATNPLVTEIDQVLTAMRAALLASIDNELVAINEQMRMQEDINGTASSKIASNPQQAKYLLSVERQQKVKESLYLYLLQKREENQLNQAFTSYNTRMIREVDGPGGPISPITGPTMMIAFAISLVLPALILYLKEVSVHVIRGRKDLKDIKIPFAGELPLYGDKKQKKFALRHVGKHDNDGLVVVKENSRNTINEAFRVVRTNIEFMFGTDEKCRVVMLSSANPGSGKTFITYNLAKSLAIKNKRVIILDLDMRRASLSKYAPEAKTGISDYLANRESNINQLIVHSEDAPTLNILPVGTIPPNPTELLFNDRLHDLIMDLRMHYDYVFIDCPPVEVVADASIISKYVDYTLFVVRAGLLDRSMIPVIEDYYAKGIYPNMSVILNGTINPRGRYARKFGNPYSYGYGYGSNYRYANED